MAAPAPMTPPDMSGQDHEFLLALGPAAYREMQALCEESGKDITAVIVEGIQLDKAIREHTREHGQVLFKKRGQPTRELVLPSLA